MTTINITTENAMQVIRYNQDLYAAPNAKGEATNETTENLQELARDYANEYELDLEETTNAVFAAYRFVYNL